MRDTALRLARVVLLLAVLSACHSGGGGSGESRDQAGGDVFSLRPVVSNHAAPCAATETPGYGSTATTCFVLGDRVLSNADVADVRASQAAPDHPDWIVEVKLTQAGSRRLDEAARAHYQQRLAIVVSGYVRSDPVVEETHLGGRIAITGLTEADARQVASLISHR